MKKFLLWALLLALLSGCVCAQASSLDYVVPLYDQRESGDVFIGTAAASADGCYFSGGLFGFSFEQPYLLTDAGKVYVSHLQQYTNGLALMTAGTTQQVVPLSEENLAGEVLLASCGENGMQLLTGRVLYPLTWHKVSCCLVEASGSVSMGTAVLDASQRLLGLVVAAWGEGLHRYVVLPVSSFDDGIDETPGTSAVTPPPSDAFIQWVEGASASVFGHILTVSWTEDILEAVQENSIVSVLLADDQNSYYSWVYGKASDGKLLIPVIPGHTYQYAVQHTYDQTQTDRSWFQHAQPLSVQKAIPFNKYSYQDTSIYLGTVPKTYEGYVSTEAEKPEAFTRAILEDDSLSVFLQVTSKYVVRKEYECDMLITLTVPGGSVFYEPASYIFLPELNENDVWNANLDGLLDDYFTLNRHYDAGEYVIQYYFDGALVNTVRFTIE